MNRQLDPNTPVTIRVPLVMIFIDFLLPHLTRGFGREKLFLNTFLAPG